MLHPQRLICVLSCGKDHLDSSTEACDCSLSGGRKSVDATGGSSMEQDAKDSIWDGQMFYLPFPPRGDRKFCKVPFFFLNDYDFVSKYN